MASKYTHNSAGVKSFEANLKPARIKRVEIIVTMSQLGNPSTIQKVTIQIMQPLQQLCILTKFILQMLSYLGLVPKPSGSSIQSEVDAEWKTWRVFPNPAKDHVNIEFNVKQSGIIVAELYRLYRQKLFTKKHSP
jgi:hypothetical protein